MFLFRAIWTTPSRGSLRGQQIAPFSTRSRVHAAFFLQHSEPNARRIVMPGLSHRGHHLVAPDAFPPHGVFCKDAVAMTAAHTQEPAYSQHRRWYRVDCVPSGLYAQTSQTGGNNYYFFVFVPAWVRLSIDVLAGSEVLWVSGPCQRGIVSSLSGLRPGSRLSPALSKASLPSPKPVPACVSPEDPPRSKPGLSISSTGSAAIVNFDFGFFIVAFLPESSLSSGTPNDDEMEVFFLSFMPCSWASPPR